MVTFHGISVPLPSIKVFLLTGCPVDIPVPPKMKPPNRLRQLDSPTNLIPKAQDAEMRLEVAARRFSILVL